MPSNDLKLYDQFASTWWDPENQLFALKHLNIPRFEYFDRFVPSWVSQRVLDVGCGGGFTGEYLASKGAIVSGVDQSASQIETATIHAAAQGLDIHYKHGVGESLPFQDASFDHVVCVDVLEHVDSLPKVVAEISRVLKPGGFLFFDTVNRTFMSKIVMIWLFEDILKEIPKGVHQWQKFIKPNELAEVLTLNGFSHIDMMGLDIRGKDKRTGMFKTKINNNKSVMYIGKCEKL